MYFEDYSIDEIRTSRGRTITEADIVNFAGLSGDFNAIHMDHEFAKTTPFRRPIAHGMLVMSIGSGLGTGSPPMRTLAFLSVRDWRFAGTVFPGDTIRVRTKILGKELRGRGKRGEIVWARTLVNQDGKVVQEGTNVTLVECRPMKREASEHRGTAVQLEEQRADGGGEA